MAEIILLLATLTASMLLTGLSRAVARKLALLDVPNQRSSHTTPTPRGGGIGIVAAFLSGLLYANYIVGVGFSGRFLMVLVAGSLLVAGIGLWDDITPLSARSRLPVHVMGAALLVWGAGHDAAMRFGSWQPELPQPLLGLILVLAVVGFLNLFNFMDGIDGLAGAEGVFVAGSAALLLSLRGGGSESLPALILAMACLGFLVWNWPPARIFMGDVGSGFLGFVLAALALRTAIFSHDLPLACWLILPGVFIADATFTLLRRMARREKWYNAHRSHAYQHAAALYGNHRPVTLVVLAINLFWLLPLSVLCVILPGFDVPLVILAYLPLLALAIKFNAGGDELVVIARS
jgi:Fuc2NAc and GlcNAc transferase